MDSPGRDRPGAVHRQEHCAGPSGLSLGNKPGSWARLHPQREIAEGEAIMEFQRTKKPAGAECVAPLKTMSNDTNSKTIPRILLVEDETNLARSLQFNLEQEGYEVRSTPNGMEAVQWLQEHEFDLIILDVMIEGMDGFEVARRVRRGDQKLPILMLTARSTEQDRIQGLELGADDYLAKPFHLRELLLRVQRMLQRTKWYAEKDRPPQEIVVAGYKVSLETLRALGPRGEIQMTALEADLLAALTSEPKRVLSRSELLERVWGYHSDVESRTVDNFIGRLRKYFEKEPDNPRHFISVRGRGYMYEP
jgi:two-component system, OmpR family, alkaline phosphatase synthesis response regulator PhoP